MATHLENRLIIYAVFHLLIFGMLALDLGVFRRRGRAISIRESLVWTGVWIALALLFNLGIYYRYEFLYPGAGRETALQFLTGYLIEKSLSIDNVFVFLLLMTYFRVPEEYQHRVLFWGIIGALIFRGTFIAVGTILIVRFQWILYIFGLFLIAAGIKMGREKDKEIHPERSPMLKLLQRLFPITSAYHDGRFFVREAGRLAITPLFVVLMMIETTDIFFALDSIPAIFAITTDPFIVYTANVFAILGLRSLYFAIAGVMRLFHHLHYGLSVILVFVGIKMIIAEAFHFKIPALYSLSFVGLCIILSIIASLIWPRARKSPAEEANMESDS